MIIFIDERTYANVDAFWECDDGKLGEQQAEVNQQLFAHVMGWA